MAHWRDGGIGNMPGSDDREAEEFTLLEKLTVIAGHSKTDEKFNVADVADEAFDEIERLRGDVAIAKAIGWAEACEMHRKVMEGLIAERDRQNGVKR